MKCFTHREAGGRGGYGSQDKSSGEELGKKDEVETLVFCCSSLVLELDAVLTLADVGNYVRMFRIFLYLCTCARSSSPFLAYGDGVSIDVRFYVFVATKHFGFY